MTLRVRLLIGILIVNAVGLLVADVATYRSLQDHLSDRINQQVRSAIRPLEVTLRARTGQQLARRSQEQFGQAGDPSNPPDSLLPGTYGQLRTSDGEILASVSFQNDDSRSTLPDLTSGIPVMPRGDPTRPVTVNSRGGNREYRVLASAAPDGLVTYAALPLGPNKDTLRSLAAAQAAASILVLVGVGLFGWWLIGLGLQPLRRMGRTADRIAGGDLSQRVPDTDPNTEVGQLGESLNSMLGQIEESIDRRRESEARLRQFLADASHELRTPLASIRGYSELFRIGGIEDEDDLEATMARIEKESWRMSDLVDDLLTLARLDKLPEAVKEPVSLGPILEESVADLRATAPDRQITFEEGGPLPVRGDPEQLRRVFGNILRNAVIHSPDGEPVEIRAGIDEGEVRVIVRDYGPGLPPGKETVVFERFWRDDDSRNQDDGGTGIGLAIVKAIVVAHGGSVSARNAGPEDAGVSKGAIFEVRLPASG